MFHRCLFLSQVRAQQKLGEKLKLLLRHLNAVLANTFCAVESPKMSALAV